MKSEFKMTENKVFILVFFKAGILLPFSFQLFQEIIFLKAYKNSLGGKSFSLKGRKESQRIKNCIRIFTCFLCYFIKRKSKHLVHETTS